MGRRRAASERRSVSCVPCSPPLLLLLLAAHAAPVGSFCGAALQTGLSSSPQQLQHPRPAAAVRCSAVPPPSPLAVAFHAAGDRITDWVEQSRSIRCPFWRTRTADALEFTLGVANFVAARHKSILDRQWLPGSDASLFEPLSLPVRPMGAKTRGLAVEEVMGIVADDITRGQYYVSGALSQAIYDDACFFDSPDPDMPCKSLGRYSDALKGLFDPKLSQIELLGMERVCDRSFIARWRISGALKLPWRPHIKPYLGATLYELGADGLVVSHNEEWSVSVLEAFAATAWPALFSEAPTADALRQDESLWRQLMPPPPRVVGVEEATSS